MNFPEDLKYSIKCHLWLRVDGDIATIGMTDYLQDKLGDFVFINVEDYSVGDIFNKDDEEFISVEAVKTTIGLKAPISGEVIEYNSELVDSPELANESPYNRGWLFKVKMLDISELEHYDYGNSEDYKAFLDSL